MTEARYLEPVEEPTDAEFYAVTCYYCGDVFDGQGLTGDPNEEWCGCDIEENPHVG
jgi:hypothetical protein